MIYQTMISRTHDGHPLTANTDTTNHQHGSDVKEGLKNMKFLSRMASRFQDRCSFYLDAVCVHFISALGLTYLVVCDTSYPPVLAFSFLDEIQKEFLQSYEKNKVDAVTRPYSLIEFDMSMQKVKQRYNNPRSLTTKLNLTVLSEELRLRPPYIISPEQLRPHNNSYNMDNNIKSNTFSTSASRHRHGSYVAMGLRTLLAVGLSLFCAVLNLTRGLAVINDAHIEDYDNDHYQYAATFILNCLLLVYQVYLLCVPVKTRRPLACATLFSICLCQLYLWEYRNNYLIIFHFIVAVFGTYVIFKRKVQEKLPQYTL
ncbi:vesicle-trafficking protein SEC22a-like [Mizuhopecten yessoensis]|uniref:Vesicle-trafficking protein SEC22a n=1 Tax=Mizuhopecten yessoensis TaxID=6573 RepID=A0A210Q484_MIZYE|nr:vesicle-trafficking protein SEC22a-like [Mizuhopecten yessoensis]OWF43535.1 Vesicle-trafficking protein SEC22a [Mizuhopecten yessoensis]